MTPDEAAWVRANVWTQDMRHAYETAPGYFHSCACQYGLTHWCQIGRCGRCHRAEPLPSCETRICGSDGETALYFPERYEYPTADAVGSRRTQDVMVWLADRVCRWVCPCTCHTRQRPEQGSLFDMGVNA